LGRLLRSKDGIDGLVHVSDISWTKRIKHPSEALKKNQEVEAMITAIDIENRRLSLSIKDLEPNAWDVFFDTHRPGDVVHGKVTRFANFGAFVELEDGIEGLCHVSELSDQHVEKPEMRSRSVRSSRSRSSRWIASQEDRPFGARCRQGRTDYRCRSYTSSDSGMASLGEIADFNIASESDNKS
jgi:small subunit ribosomal protein S1